MSTHKKGGQQSPTGMKPFCHQDHPRPVTRRELLGQGFMAGSAFVMMPSFLSMLVSRQAEARDLVCTVGGGAGAPRFTPFIVFDLSGGGNIAGSNVIVGKAGGQSDFLSTYSSLGLPDAMSPKVSGQTNNEYGLLFHADSAILRGMNTATTVTTRAQTDGAIFCTSSGDDQPGNPHNPVFWIAKAGATGELVQLTGTNSTTSGGNSAAPADSINPAIRPVVIVQPSDVLGLVNPGKLATLLSPKDVETILGAARSMSASKLAKFQAMDLQQQIKDLVECGYMKGGELVAQAADASLLDPTQDADVTGIFKNLATDKDEQRVASMAKLILTGKAAAGTVEMAQFDYHDNTRATGETQDQNVGKLIGQVLELAAKKKSDVMIYVFTDGGVTSNGQADNSTNGRGKGAWQADSSQRSSAFSLVYNKDAGKRPPLLLADRRQIGAFTDAGGVDESTNKISASVDSLARAVTGNYLALHGMADKLAQVVGTDPFGADFSKSYQVFSKLR